MGEQRLIDANNYKEALKALPDIAGKKAAIDLLMMMPTIDPESLPVVRRLRKQVQTLQKELQDWYFWYGPVREAILDGARQDQAAVKVTRKRCEKIIAELRTELSKVTAERDAAVEQLRGDCEKCAHYRVTWNGCTPDFECTLSDSCLNRDMWEWRGPRKEE